MANKLSAEIVWKAINERRKNGKLSKWIALIVWLSCCPLTWQMAPTITGIESKRQRRRMVERIKTLERELNERLSRASGPDWPSIISILDQGANADYETSNGTTPLLAAANDDPNSINSAKFLDTNMR